MIAERLRAVGRIALLSLAVVLPFEMMDPLARLGPLQLSSVELFLYLALACWGASLVAAWVAGERALGPWLRRLPAAHRAVLCFAVVVMASAMAATAPRAPGFKFALRSLGGMLLYAAAADLLRAPGAATRTAIALVVRGIVTALLAIAEVHVAVVAALLRRFHFETFEALGRARASGPFQYPNIAAMYLEAITPVAVALGLAPEAALGGHFWGARARRVRVASTAIVTFILLDGVLATGSRAGLLGALASVAVLGAVGVRSPPSRRAAWGAIAAAVAVTVLASGSALGGRLRFWHDGDWYRAVITQAGGAAGRLPPLLATSGTASEIIEVQNQGALPWRHEPPAPVALSYHWLDAATGKMVTRDGLRTGFEDNIYTGGGARVRARVEAPARPGRYVLWWDLVHEHTVWFSERGNTGLREEVIVRGDAPVAVDTSPATLPPPLSERKILPRQVLWPVGLAMFRAHPLLGIGPDNFRHRYGEFLGLDAREVDERVHANSLYVETLADLGAAGVLVFGFVVVALFKAARRAAAGPRNRILAFGAAAGLATFLLHGLLDYFLEFTPTYALFWLLAGMIVAIDRSREISA